MTNLKESDNSGSNPVSFANNVTSSSEARIEWPNLVLQPINLFSLPAAWKLDGLKNHQVAS